MGEAIISGVIFGFCALIMLAIGSSQWKSKKPVGFYTGEKPPKAENISNVKAWNRQHGAMWMLYGICILLAWVCGLFLGDSIWTLIPFTAGLLVPIPVIIWYHNRLIRKYVIQG